MNWKIGSFWDGVVAREKGARVKLVTPELNDIEDIDNILSDLNGMIALIETVENKPAEASDGQKEEKPETVEQNASAPEIQSEEAVCEDKPKRRGGRPKKRLPVDTGKIKALYEAGWSVAEIASDVHQPEDVVREVLES